MPVGWQGVEGEVEVAISATGFLRSPENVGGVAGCRWGSRVKVGW